MGFTFSEKSCKVREKLLHFSWIEDQWFGSRYGNCLMEKEIYWCEAVRVRYTCKNLYSNLSFTNLSLLSFTAVHLSSFHACMITTKLTIKKGLMILSVNGKGKKAPLLSLSQSHKRLEIESVYNFKAISFIFTHYHVNESVRELGKMFAKR